MSNWTKEEIMAYADGQLEEKSMKRIQDAIASDPNAKDFYETMIYGDELIKDTMQQLETTFKTTKFEKNQSPQSKYRENSQKVNSNIKLKSHAISIKSIFIPALVGLIIFASGGYFIGKNTQEQLLMRGIDDSKLSEHRNEIENFLNLGSDGENYTINKSEKNKLYLTILETSFGQEICRKVLFENNQNKQFFIACKKGEAWSITLSD